MTNDFGNRDYDRDYNRNYQRWENSGSGPGFEDSYGRPGPEGNYGGGGYWRGQGRQGNFNVPTWQGYASNLGPSWQGYGYDYNRGGSDTGYGYGRRGDFAYHNNFGGTPNYHRAMNRRYGDFGSPPERKFYRDLNPGEGNYGMNTDYRSQDSFGSNRQDWWNDQGPYSGRGPKNYRRSDERINEDVCRRLEHAGNIDASDIEVNTNSGIVTLSGTVDSRQAKRMAENAAESVWGVKDVQNQLQVQQSSNQRMQGSMSRQNEAMTQ